MAFLEQMQQVGLDLLVAQQLHAAVVVPRQLLDGRHIGPLGAPGKAAQHHRIEHALAKRCHDKSPWTRGPFPASKVSPQCRSKQAPRKIKTRCRPMHTCHHASSLVQRFLLMVGEVEETMSSGAAGGVRHESIWRWHE